VEVESVFLATIILFYWVWYSVVQVNDLRLTLLASAKLCGFILCCVKQCKKCDFYLGGRDFIMFLVIGQLNGPLASKLNIWADLSQFFSILSDCKCYRAPPQALQIIFEMQKQRTRKKKNSKENMIF